MEQAFVQLINAHRGLICKVCHLYVHEPEGRKDLFQEIVLQLWRSYGSFRGESRMSTWIYRVALNTAISNFRKETRQPERRSVPLSTFDIPEITDLTEESHARLYRAIHRLSDVEKAVVLLYLEEKSYAEISGITGISVSNVGVKLNRIKSKLETILQSETL